MCDGILHGLLGDLVEHDAMDVLGVKHVTLLEEFDQVPGNGLTFTVRVSGQVQRVRLLQRTDDRFDVLLVAINDLVLHREVIIRVDGAFLRHEVTYMTVRSHDIEVLAKVLADCLCLGGRLNNDEIF